MSIVVAISRYIEITNRDTDFCNLIYGLNLSLESFKLINHFHLICGLNYSFP